MNDPMVVMSIHKPVAVLFEQSAIGTPAVFNSGARIIMSRPQELACQAAEAFPQILERHIVSWALVWAVGMQFPYAASVWGGE
jgi:hypothetical protein